MTADRYAWDITFPIGRAGEVFVAEVLAAERPGIEVKTDTEAAHTGNVYIEYECLKAEGWAPSGIADPALPGEGLWAFVLGSGVEGVVVVATVEAVRALARHYWTHDPRTRAECVRGTHPTRGVAVPLDRFLLGLVHAWAYTSASAEAG